MTHLSVGNMINSSDSIISFDRFSSLTHLALDQCSCIGPSLAAYKSPKLKGLRISCHVLDRRSVEELENIRSLIDQLQSP